MILRARPSLIWLPEQPDPAPLYNKADDRCPAHGTQTSVPELDTRAGVKSPQRTSVE